MKITAVVVTYNRLELLKQSLSAIARQSRSPDQVIVVNNASTDGTQAYLETWSSDTNLVITPTSNTGGAGGFATGIHRAYELGADWVWVMDDDSEPATDCLDRLLSLSDRDDVGFVAPIVRWKDGSFCRSNVTEAHPIRWAEEFSAPNPIVRISTATFVGLLLNRRAIKLCGLPVAEFFIWYDDIEFTDRVSKVLKGFCVTSANIVHLIPANEFASFSRVTRSSLWKHQFGIRNEVAVTVASKSYGIVRAVLLLRSRLNEMKQGGVSFTLRARVIFWGLKGLFFRYRSKIVFP